MKFVLTRFDELKEGSVIKHPARGKNARQGTVINIQSNKTEYALLIRWHDDDSVSTACQPGNYEIMKKEK